MNSTAKLIGIIIWLIQNLSYCYIAFSNPGIPSFNNKFKAENNEDGTNYKFCKYCQLYYDLSAGTNHCRECDVCIQGNITNIY